jgi:hypothetical protein
MTRPKPPPYPKPPRPPSEPPRPQTGPLEEFSIARAKSGIDLAGLHLLPDSGERKVANLGFRFGTSAISFNEFKGRIALS